jgi:hypothetical protein
MWARSIIDAAYNSNMPVQSHILNSTTGNNTTNTDALPQPQGSFIKVLGCFWIACLFLLCLFWCLQHIYSWGVRDGRHESAYDLDDYDADLEWGRGRFRLRACDRKLKRREPAKMAPPNRIQTPYSPQRQYETFVPPFRPESTGMGRVHFERERMDTRSSPCVGADGARCMVCLRCRRMYDGVAIGMYGLSGARDYGSHGNEIV